MAETPLGRAPDTAERAAQERRELVIEAALDYMAHQDWYSSDEDDDPEVLAQLERL